MTKTDNSTSQLGLHHLLRLFIISFLTHHPLLPFFCCLCSPTSSVSFLAVGDHSEALPRGPFSKVLCFQCQTDGDRLSTQTPPFSYPPSAKRPGKGVGPKGLSCYPELNKVELLAWWRMGWSYMHTAVKVLNCVKVRHWSLKWIQCKKLVYSDVLRLFNMVLLDFNISFKAHSSIRWKLHLSDLLWQMLGLLHFEIIHILSQILMQWSSWSIKEDK